MSEEFIKWLKTPKEGKGYCLFMGNRPKDCEWAVAQGNKPHIPQLISLKALADYIIEEEESILDSEKQYKRATAWLRLFKALKKVKYHKEEKEVD